MRWLAWLCWWRPPCLLRMVIANLKSPRDEAVKGLLWRSRGRWLVLRQCTGMREGQPPMDIDAEEVIIARDNVSFLQVLP